MKQIQKLKIQKLFYKLRLIRTSSVYKIYLDLKSSNASIELLHSTNYGFKMFLHLKEWIDFNIFFWGFYEKYETRYFSKNIETGITFFDVGANIGYYTLIFSGKGCRCHSFEPVKGTFLKLISNVELNSFSNATLNNFGISSTCCSREINISPDACGNNSLENKFQTKQTEQITLKTLDDYCLEKDIDQIDLLKIDVEGHENEVLLGAGNLLYSFKIKKIFIEINDVFHESVYQFLAQNYDWYKFTKKGLTLASKNISGNALLILKEEVAQ